MEMVSGQVKVSDASVNASTISVHALTPISAASTADEIKHSDRIKREILDLAHRSLWHLTGSGLVFPPRRDSLNRADTEPESVQVLYATEGDGKVVGFLVLHLGAAISSTYAAKTVACLIQLGTPVPAFIRSLCVDREIRRKGIGQALLRGALSVAAERGATAVAGHVKSHPDSDHRMLTAFSRAGFKESQGRVVIRGTREKDGGFSRLDDHPWGRDQIPQNIEIEYVVWVAPATGFRLVSSGDSMQVVPSE